MKVIRHLALVGLSCVQLSCFSREEKPIVVVSAVPASSPSPAAKVSVKEDAAHKDKSLDIIVRYFEQSDSIHREAWWVLTDERRPVGKSPFGKVQRAIMSSQNIKLTNKSLFRCDRYLVKRDVMGLQGYPQKGEVFEKCSEKIAAKKIAEFSASRPEEVQVTFFPENLEEILGLGATVLNKQIQCALNGNEQGQLLKLKCKDWAQDRNKEQMIRLDVYEYEKSGRNMIKLRGKVYENLTDIRKVEADVPMEGKISVTETELYPAETPKPTPTPAKTPVVQQERVPGAPPMTLPPEDASAQGQGGGAVPVAPLPEGIAPEITPLHLPPPRGENAVDPDVMMQRQQNESGEIPQDHEMIEEAPQPEQPAAGGVYGR